MSKIVSNCSHFNMNKINLSSIPLQPTIVSLFFIVLIGATWIYWAGLHGTYLLDDNPNLSALGDINESTDKFTDIVRFTTEGTAGQLGRPVSLITFALQTHYWQGTVWHFKYVNLMIHLLNGCLIFWLLLYLTRIMALPEKRGLWLALLTTSLWLLHPFQVSTVLYIIQRMTELSALFTLAALLIYVRSRQRFAEGLLTPTAFWISISIGIGLGGILATLSKENGVLLILYVLVLEATVLRALPKPRYWQIWCGLFLYLPLFILISYFIWNFNGILDGYDIRHFTLGERLLTQTRILTEYLFKILIPRPNTYGLFHDDYIVSRSLLEPVTTVIAVGFITLMFVAALLWRNKYPIFALGVLWFLAGHVLESSFIGLMLYFEHRNYLPMLGVLFAIICGAFWMFEQMRVIYLRKLAILFSAVYLGLFTIATWLETDLWGKPLVQAKLWAEEHPLSRQAQSHVAELFCLAGGTQEAEKYYQHMVEAFPEDSGPYVLWLSASCHYSDIALPDDMSEVMRHLSTTKGDNATIASLNAILKQYELDQCTQLKTETIETLLKTLANNKNILNTYKKYLYQLYARFYGFQDRFAEAIRMADNSLALSANNKHLRLQRLVWLQIEGRHTDALDEIAKIRANLNLVSNRIYLEDLNRIEKATRKRILEIQQEQNDNHTSN
jgi:tetratricopeptide (TPR) repeat protein